MLPNESPKVRLAGESALVLQKTLRSQLNDLTIADAATKSGLPLRDAESGLHFLVSEYRGSLKATQTGELLFSFPHGFTKPWETTDALKKFWQKTKQVTLGVAKFVVRAWISIVMVAYVAIFALILIGLMLANKSSDRDDNRGGSLGGTLLFHTLLRVVLDSLFWTFHPFSPFYVGNRYDDAQFHGRQRAAPKMPFYEKVNRFFFGPEKKPEDPMENTRRILATIRAGQGRIGLFDVLRVTGFTKDQADPLMSRLLLDYDGDVKVSDSGGITYQFPELRKSAQERENIEPQPIWAKPEKQLPMTGNPAGSNFMIAGLNSFNLMMGFVAIQSGWTVEKLQFMFTAGAFHAKHGFFPPMPPEGTPLVLGWIPFAFSAFLFGIPVMRALNRGRDKRRIERENGRRGLMRVILSPMTPRGVQEETLRRAWKDVAGRDPTDRELIREVVKLGGNIEVADNGTTTYRFPELEAETQALLKERANASGRERDVGEVVFSSAR